MRFFSRLRVRIVGFSLNATTIMEQKKIMKHYNPRQTGFGIAKARPRLWHYQKKEFHMLMMIHGSHEEALHKATILLLFLMKT